MPRPTGTQTGPPDYTRHGGRTSPSVLPPKCSTRRVSPQGPEGTINVSSMNSTRLPGITPATVPRQTATVRPSSAANPARRTQLQRMTHVIISFPPSHAPGMILRNISACFHYQLNSLPQSRSAATTIFGRWAWNLSWQLVHFSGHADQVLQPTDIVPALNESPLALLLTGSIPSGPPDSKRTISVPPTPLKLNPSLTGFFRKTLLQASPPIRGNSPGLLCRPARPCPWHLFIVSGSPRPSGFTLTSRDSPPVRELRTRWQ